MSLAFVVIRGSNDGQDDMDALDQGCWSEGWWICLCSSTSSMGCGVSIFKVAQGCPPVEVPQ